MIATLELAPIESLPRVTLRTPDLSKPVSGDWAEHLPTPQVRFPVAPTPVPRPVTAAPQADTSVLVEMRPYVARAGLLPGEGATVVMRVQVLESGNAGQILVEVSSGHRQVDAAAMAYARAHRWIPAKSGSQAQTVWIRFGVRLQA